MRFEIVSAIINIETIATGGQFVASCDFERHTELVAGRSREMKGVATIRLSNGRMRLAEIHWYEAHGIGRKEFKRKRYLD